MHSAAANQQQRNDAAVANSSRRAPFEQSQQAQQQGAGPTSQPAQPQQTPATRCEPESTVPLFLARICNLGWDTSSDILIERACVFLFTAVTGSDGKGSSAEAIFTTQSAFQSAKIRMQEQAK